MSVQEEVHSDLNPMKRGSPLPWLLLGITLVVGVTMAWTSHARIVDEKQRTARALQANDEVVARLRGVVAENQRLTESLDAQRSEADTQKKSLEEQLKASTEELAKYRANPRCRK